MAHDTSRPKPRAVLVGLTLPGGSEAETTSSLVELGRLVKTLGYEVASTLSQRRSSSTGATVLGDGKLKELAGLTGGKGVVKRTFARKTKAALRREEAHEEERDDAECVAADTDSCEPEDEDASNASPTHEVSPAGRVDCAIFDCELSPSQIANLQHALGVDVLDRTGVIVQIFSRHARTREARLQVEIARLKYLAPRVRHAGAGEDRTQLGGERSIELDRRRIRDRIAELRQEIAQLATQQSAHRTARHEHPCVALVGYTNAGKSSMMRALTGSQVLVEDKLFATLDTTVRALAPPSIPPILISDTVGFIKKLPHDLVASFRSTLEEAKNADLLLFVVDASDAAFREQLKVTHEVLASIDVTDIPSLLVLNKCDQLEQGAREALARELPTAILMSAHDKAQVAALRERLIASFEADRITTEVFVPYTAPRAIGSLRSRFRITGERYDEHGTWLEVRAERDELAAVLDKLGLSTPPGVPPSDG